MFHAEVDAGTGTEVDSGVDTEVDSGVIQGWIWRGSKFGEGVRTQHAPNAGADWWRRNPSSNFQWKAVQVGPNWVWRDFYFKKGTAVKGTKDEVDDD